MKKRKLFIFIAVLLVLGIAASLAYYLAVKLPEKRQKEEQQQKYNQFYAQMLKAYETENGRYEDFQVDVAFLGDSITAGYAVESYYPEYLVTNRGIGGETTYGLLDRLAVSVLDLKPKV